MYQFLTKLFLAGAVLAAFVILPSGPVLAQTPDGETPALEAVCDELKGGTPGLYGLCVAFCEAQDLEDAAELIKAGGVPGEKIVERYNAKKLDGDPEMPCLVTASVCPCFNSALCVVNMAEPQSQCGFQVENVSEIFAGRACDVLDICLNEITIADDFCESLPSSLRPRAFVTVTVGTVAGTCIAGTREDLAFQAIQNLQFLDPATAQVCLDEVNAFDGNVFTDSAPVDPCGLGD